MLEFVSVKNFKSLKEETFELSNLNIFSGINGMGKSSFLQTILLLRQSFEQSGFSGSGFSGFLKGLLLNGYYVNLGNGQDILSRQAETDIIDFVLCFNDDDILEFKFSYDPYSELQPLLKTEPLLNTESFYNIANLSLFNTNFQYLSAERIAPKNSYPMSSLHIQKLKSLGINGEYTAHFIAEYSTKNLPLKELRHEKAGTSLIENLNCWMSEISPDIQVQVEKRKETNTVDLTYLFKEGNKGVLTFKPQNVGFGVTFVLPVLTAILRAKKDDIVIIENPESHLHPAAQATLGKICALAAKGGVQLFIETHSDHFLNGIRVAVKEGLLDPDYIKLYFFERELSSHRSKIYSPKMDENGRIDPWPEGFFDENIKQLEKLL